MNVLNNDKVFKELRDRRILWETLCVGDRQNAKAPRPLRGFLRGIYERLYAEDLLITLRVVDFKGREILHYEKVPSINQFLRDVKEASDKNDKLFALTVKAKAAGEKENPKPAPQAPPKGSG